MRKAGSGKYGNERNLLKSDSHDDVSHTECVQAHGAE